VSRTGESVEGVLARVRSQLDLDAETEYELLEELRGHLEDAVAAARMRGLDEQAALARAVARFGVEDVGRDLQATHLGWGAADGVVAAALPVICALLLRWMVFAPDGTAVGWQGVLARPVFWAVAVVSLLVPLFKFTRWRYAVASWIFFWLLSVIFFAWPALHW